MRKRSKKYIVIVFVAVLAVLTALLYWNNYKIYLFEKKYVADEINNSIENASKKIQRYNNTLLNNIALAYIDKEFDRKVAFASGFMQNRGNMNIEFADSINQQPPVKQDVPPDNFDDKFFKAKKIKYKPESVFGINKFDSVLKLQMVKDKTFVGYSIHKFVRQDTMKGDSLQSASFIINFTAPQIYYISYPFPRQLILKQMVPYLLATAIFYIMLIAGFTFYYRSYKLQSNMTRFREMLLGNMAHELKTPVTSLQLIIDDAQKNIVSDTVPVPVKHIIYANNELKRIKMLIEKILSFKTMSAEQFVFNKEWVDIDGTINEVIQSFSITAEQAGANIVYNSSGKLNYLGDSVLLANAVSAMIDNAIKYSNRPQVISINVKTQDGYIIISVSNNGPKIDTTYRKKIFEPFFRIPSGNVYNTQGHGLGLSFATEIARLHGGNIYFTSDEHETIFYLKLKLS